MEDNLVQTRVADEGELLALRERLHEGFLRFFAVLATHLPLTLRPATFWANANANVTLADSFNVNENVVPTGDLCFLVNVARLLAPTQLRLVSDTAPTIGLGVGGITGGATGAMRVQG